MGLSVCRDPVITSAAAFAIVHHAPAVQPDPHAGRPQARGVLSRVDNRPAAARMQRWRKGMMHFLCHKISLFAHADFLQSFLNEDGLIASQQQRLKYHGHTVGACHTKMRGSTGWAMSVEIK